MVEGKERSPSNLNPRCSTLFPSLHLISSPPCRIVIVLWLCILIGCQMSAICHVLCNMPMWFEALIEPRFLSRNVCLTVYIDRQIDRHMSFLSLLPLFLSFRLYNPDEDKSLTVSGNDSFYFN